MSQGISYNLIDMSSPIIGVGPLAHPLESMQDSLDMEAESGYCNVMECDAIAAKDQPMGELCPMDFSLAIPLAPGGCKAASASDQSPVIHWKQPTLHLRGEPALSGKDGCLRDDSSQSFRLNLCSVPSQRLMSRQAASLSIPAFRWTPCHASYS